MAKKKVIENNELFEFQPKVLKENINDFEDLIKEKRDKNDTGVFIHTPVYYDDNTVLLQRNFESRLRQSDENLKSLYSEIKNTLMAYSGVNGRMLKMVEVFRCNGVLAKIRIKGKSLYLYLKVDPASIDAEFLKVVDKSMRRGYEETPCEIKITGKRKLKRSIMLIKNMMTSLGFGKRRKFEPQDYCAMYQFVDNAVIEGKNMIKKD
ncbi:MAG: hypothetical protein RRY78_00360 [Clostridia bacterium]